MQKDPLPYRDSKAKKKSPCFVDMIKDSCRELERRFRNLEHLLICGRPAST